MQVLGLRAGNTSSSRWINHEIDSVKDTNEARDPNWGNWDFLMDHYHSDSPGTWNIVGVGEWPIIF